MRGTEQDTGRIGVADRAAAADAVEPVPVSSKAGIPCAAFTPAPWLVRETRNMTTNGPTIPVSNSDDFPAAFVPAWTNDASEEAEANARLIATAPDYDAFTVEALPQLEVLHSILPAGESRNAVWRVILKGRAALSKARGEQVPAQ